MSKQEIMVIGESCNEYEDSLIEPIYFGSLKDTIKDTITAKLLRAVATRKDLYLLSCNISEYNRTGDALVEDGEGRPSSLYYDAEKDKWI